MSSYLMQGRHLRRPVLGCGIKFPFEFSPSLGSTLFGTATSEDEDRINQGIWQLLSTGCAVGDTPGEDESLPDYGSQLRLLRYRKIGYETRPLITAYVIDPIKKWERRIVLTDISFNSDAIDQLGAGSSGLSASVLAALERVEAGIEIVNIGYTIIQTQRPGNCVFPFYVGSDLTMQGYGYVYARAQ
ncbi:MAG: GPW/gp25 family protein [Chlamydiota bacterium]